MSGPKKNKPWENNYQVDTEEAKPWEKKYELVKKKDDSGTTSASTSGGTKSDSQSGTVSSVIPKTIDNIVTRSKKNYGLDIPKQTKYRDEKLNADIDSKYPVGSIAWSQEKLKANVPGYTSIYDDFKKTETVDDAKKAQIAQEVEDEENEKGFFNTVKGTLSRAFSKLPTFLGGTTGKDAVPLYKEKEEAKKILQQEALLAKSQKKPIPQITQEAITQKAKEIAIDKRVKSQSDSQVRDLLKSYESSNPDKKDALLKYSALEKASLGEKDKLLIGKQNILRSEIDNSLNTIKEYNNQIKELSDKGIAVPDELKTEYENEASKYQSLLNDAISSQNEYISNTKKLGNINDNIDIFKRDYGWINNFVGNIDATLGDLSAGIAGAIDYGLNVKSKLLNSPKLNALDTPIRELAKGVSKDLKADADERRSGLMKPISVEEINTPSDFGTWFSNTVLANQVPIFATVATGAPGIATLGVSATGSKFEEMQSDGQEYSNMQQIGIPLAFGATETASAIVDNMLLGNASRVIRSATAPERKLIAEGVWKGIMENTGEILKGGIAEGLDESGTQIAQNIIDKYAGDKKNVEIFDNVKDAGYAGAIMGMMIPFSSSVVSQAVKPFTIDNNIQKATSQLNNLEAQLANPDLTEETRNIIAKQTEKAKYNLENLLKTKVQDIEALPDGQFQEIIDIEKSQSKLKNQAREIQADNSIDQATKEQIISGLKEEFDQTEKRRTDLLERGPNAVLSTLDEEEVIRLKDLASKELMKELNPDGTKNINLNDRQISKKAVEIYNKEQSINLIKDEKTNIVEEQETQPQAEEQTQGDKIITISNEAAPQGNISTDGNIQPGPEILETGRNTKQQGSSGEIVQETNDTRTNPEAIKIKLSNKGEVYNVIFNNGRLDITNNSGSEPSAPTRRKIEEKYSEGVDFTSGDLAPATNEAVDMNSYIADTSNNPAEVAMTLLSIDNQSFVEENVSHKDRVIAENIGKIKRQSFIDNGDANYINRSMAKSYFNNDGSSLDTLSQEMSEIAGIEITEQDIVDFILENPNGPQTFFSKAKREAREPLQKRFSELTGLPASDKFLQKAIEQQIAKDEFLKEYATGLSEMTDEQLLSLQSELELYNNQTNEQETTFTSAKGANQTSNIEGSKKESGVQNESGQNVNENQTGASEEINLSRDLKLDQFIKNLDKAIEKLDEFGKENLGMNIPLVLARQALNAMKIAAQTASTVADIISAGLNIVKQSDWYNNLSNKEKLDLETNFTDYLNKPFQTNRKKSRFKIEEEVESEIQEGTSEKDILDQYEDRREKMIAKDYLQRKKSVSESEAKNIVDDSFKKADDLLANNKKLGEKISEVFRKVMSKIVDRQFVPKFVLNKAGGRLVRNYIIATKGASGYARMIYDEAYDKTYKGLTSKEIKILDKVIQLKRFIAIDENRSKKDLPAVVHPDYINENIAKKYLESLEKEIGTKDYSDMLKRADAYFGSFKLLLDEMEKSGIISKSSRDQFFDIDYQPRMFLEFLKSSEEELIYDIDDTGSLADKQIKKLEDGLDTSLVTDSQYLLSRAINVRTKSIAMNNTNKKLAEFIESQKVKVDELRKKNNPTKKEKETIKYFGELEKKVIPNHIIDFSDSGEPKYKIPKLPKGFRNAYYYINGVKQNILMEENFHDQYFDNLNGLFNGNAKETVAMASGVGLVKSIATGNNPTFFITNTPRDFMFISTFSDEYGKNVLLNMAKLAKDSFKGINDIRKSNDNFKNFIRYGGMMDFLKDQGKFKGNKGLKKLLNKVDNKTKEDFNKFFDIATLNKLQVYSEIGFRMAVFNRSIKNQLKDLGLKSISEVSDQVQIDDIYTNAVASARSTMDFNQGGTITKDADALIPYLNAATQGTRVMFDNFRERPVETTFRALQTATLLSSAAVGTSIALLSAYNDDDDKTGAELYQKALDGVSKYEQTNYFIVFTGKRTADGEFEYYRIAKAQQLTPFFSASEGIMNDFIRNSIDYKGKSRTISNINFALSNNISPLEFSVTGNITKNPIIKAALSYSVGYDFFRDQDLSYLKGKVPVQAEGFENKNVEDFYKKIGEDAGISPVRMKAAVESMITTPSTSPYVGFLYGGLDALASDKEGKQILQKLGTDLAKSTVKRAMKETSDFNRKLNSREDIQEKLIKAESETLKTKSKFKELSDGLIEKTITQKFVDKEIEKIEKENPFEAKRLGKMISDRVKNKNVSPYVFEIKYARSADHKALLLIQMFGDNLKNPNKLDREEKKLYNDLLQVKAISKEAMFEYQNMINKKTAE